MKTNEIWVRHSKRQDEQARRRELRTPYSERTEVNIVDSVFRDYHANINRMSLGNGATMKLAILPDESLT